MDPDSVASYDDTPASTSYPETVVDVLTYKKVSRIHLDRAKDRSTSEESGPGYPVAIHDETFRESVFHTDSQEAGHKSAMPTVNPH